MYKEIFKNMIREALDPQEQTQDQFISRQTEIRWMPRKATVVKGVRRAGKSTCLAEIIPQAKKEQDLFIPFHFADERLTGLKAEDLGGLLEAIEALFELKNEKIWFLFDEIQLVQKWELFVERLLRSPRYVVSITGSSARLLSQEIATEMRGRSLQFEIFPFSFEEFLRADSRLKLPVRLNRSAILAKKLDQFLLQGGFPELIHANKKDHVRILQEYFEAIFFRDVVERNEIKDHAAAKRLTRELIIQTATMITVNKSFEKMKSMGFKIQKSFVTEMIQALEDCYCCFTVPLFTESISKQNANPKKVYAIDTGLAISLKAGFSENRGRLLETAIFLELKRKEHQIFYFKNQHEVDFLSLDSDGEKNLYQVSYDLSDKETLDREIQGLQDALKKHKCKRACLIFVVPPRVIPKIKGVQMIPAWEFLLETP